MADIQDLSHDTFAALWGDVQDHCTETFMISVENDQQESMGAC